MKKSLKSVPSVAFQATDYPITVAEVPQASEMLDKMLTESQRTELVDCLAYQPDVGEPITQGSLVRTNVFAFKTSGGCEEVSVVYFFHDLNMPLYILAVYEGETGFTPDDWEEEKMNNLAAKLVQTGIGDVGRTFQNNV